MTRQRRRLALAGKEPDEWIREGLARMRAARDWVIRWPRGQRAPNYLDHPDYQKAVGYRKEWSPTEGVAYDWVCAYAQVTYGWLHDAFNNLDDKADSIVRHLSGGTGLLTLGAIGFISQSGLNAAIALLALPALVCALQAIRVAISVRRPTATTSPPSVEGAVRYAESYGAQAQATFLGQWHECSEGLALVVAEKARLVRAAYGWYLTALVLLLLPFVGGAVLKLSVPPSTGQAAAVTNERPAGPVSPR